MQTLAMKKLLHSTQVGLVAALVLLPALLRAQSAVFTDTFGSSTLNGTSNPGGTPSASSTSYDIASTKTGQGSLTGGHLHVQLSSATGSGVWEVQAKFAASPIALLTPGDYINLTYVFSGTNLCAGGTASSLNHGLFNSGGTVPVAGNLASSGLAGTAYTTGNCANWSGYVGLFGSNAVSRVYTRAIQNAGAITNANQDLLFNAAGGGCYNNPGGTNLDINTQTNPLTLTVGGTYTVSYTIVLASSTNVTVTNNLYSGTSVTGTPLMSIVQSSLNPATFLATSFDGFAIGARNSGTSLNPQMDITKVVISTSIAGSPGPNFTVTGGGTSCPGDLAAVGLSGSVTTNVYLLYTNGVYAGQTLSGTGSALTFSPETVLPVTFTNTILASNPATAFFGFMSGSALISPTAAPVITNQPVAALTSTNGLAAFVVGASGGGLGYQWYKNGVKLTDGAEIAGSSTAVLLINPATTADVASAAAGYYCVITNLCGLQVVSATNSLTLDAPANLAWQGGNPNNLWDLATTPNFNFSPATVFHNGDIVNLTDNTGNTAITVVGSAIAPSLVNLNANAQNYSLSGAPLIGPGALLLSGSGTLSVSNANSFSGGTTISNGQLNVANYGGLGSGPVTLAGGTLYLPLQGGSATGLTNNLNVVGNTTLQYYYTGTYGSVLFGSLNGNSGATLTINVNNSAYPATSRLRLYAPFTNNAAIVLGTSGSTPEIAPYAATGQQVFNGPISGNGHLLPRGVAPVVLTGNNTFQDANNVGVIISGGSVGLGADSVLSGGSLVSSPVGLGSLEIDPSLGNATFFAVNGDHLIANPLTYLTATNLISTYFNGSNSLTFSGNVQIGLASDPYGTNRIWNVSNNSTFTGAIVDNGKSSILTKAGNGNLYLDNLYNTFNGGLTNTAGLLAGTGAISTPTTILAGSSLGGGDSSGIGTFTISNNLSLAGNLYIRVNKSLSQSNDEIFVSGTVANSGTGTVTVTNLGSKALTVGDRFPLFNQAVTGGAALAISGGGVTWSNGLAVDGSIKVLAIASSVPPISYLKFAAAPVINGTSLSISATNTGGGNVYLLMTTNLATPVVSWKPVWTNTLAGTGTFTTNIANLVNPALGQQFYLMSTNN